MGVTDIFLLFVVTVTVIVSFILDSFEKTHKTNNHRQSSPVFNDFENEAEPVSFIDHDQQQVKEIVDEEDETESPVPETSNFCSEKEDFFDDWEDIERTELEKLFGKALVFVSKTDRFDEDLNLQLYALQKVAFEGPCYGSQPMALKVTARSKWNAWEKLGNMSREIAMETYIMILSIAVPDWDEDESNQYVVIFKQPSYFI